MTGMQDQQCDVAIIGAGIVGLGVGLSLVRKYPRLKVVVLDKEAEVATHQTGHNSGVIHSGLYYKPGSLKARLCVSGSEEMIRFCAEHEIPYDRCGKIIVATDESELPNLAELSRRARENGLREIRDLDGEQIKEIEPHAAGIRGIFVPSTAITDFKQVARKYRELIERAGGDVMNRAEVTGVRDEQGGVVLETASGVVHTRYAVNCAGLHSDRIARMSGANLDLQIIPFRGEYYELIPEKYSLVKGLIYPVADPRFPFLGVHFTRRIQGGVEAGPNAVLSFKREGYKRTSFSPADSLNTAAFPGFWKMARRNWKSGTGEMYRSWSKKAFTRALQKLVPSITQADIREGGAGVRAQAVDKSGKLIDDFFFAQHGRILHVCNVPSPAATASLAIGREIVEKLGETAQLA